MKKINVLFLSVIFLLTACDKPKVINNNSPVTVEYIVLQTEPIVIHEYLFGRVKALLNSEVRPQVDGIIKERLFEEGQRVNEGQILYKLDDASYQAIFNQAKANLDKNRINTELAQIRSERVTSLASRNAISIQDKDDALYAYESAKAELAAAQAEFEVATINLSRTEIKAPVSGIIGISTVTVGALVTSNQVDPLTTILAQDNVYVDIPQSVEQILNIQKLKSNKIIKNGDDKVRLLLPDGNEYPFTGKIQLKEDVVNETTGTVTIRSIFPNPDGQLMSGMYVRAIVDDVIYPKAFLVPQQGVIWDKKGNSFVMVLNQDNKVEKKSIIISRTENDKWIVISGLNDGDKLILSGLNRIKTGDIVNPVIFNHLENKE